MQRPTVVSIITPAYHEESNIEEFVRRAMATGALPLPETRLQRRQA